MNEKTKLELVDPTGRLDLFVFRLADALARRRWPQLWPHIRGQVSDALEDLFQERPRSKRRSKRRD